MAPRSRPRSRTGGAAKRRSPDCRNCLFLRSLADAGLAADAIEGICGRMWLNRVARNQVLFLEGSRAGHLYAVRSGRVRLVKIDESGREHTTAILESGDLFGVEAAFDSEYATGAQAMTDAEVCQVSAADLRNLIADVPRFALELTRYLNYRLGRAQEQLVYLQSRRACERLARFLLHHLPDDPGSPPTVPWDMSLRELGSALGLTPESVCRAVAALRAEGILANGPGGVRIRDVEALRTRCGRP